MEKQKSIKKNYVFNTMYQVFALIVPLITAPYISRVLGASGVGVYSYANSIVSIFDVFALLGTSVYGQQIIAQCRDDKEKRSKNFFEIELICIFTTVLTLACWFFFIASIEKYKLYFIILTLNLISVGLDISWFFAGLEDFSVTVLRSFIIKLLTVICIFVFVKDKDDLALYFIIQSAGQAIGNLSLWIPLRSRVIKIPISTFRLKEHFKQTFVYFIPTIAGTVYNYFDKTMIGLITESEAQNGYYEQAQKIVNMGYTVVASLNTVMASRIAYLFAKGNTEEIKRRFCTSSDFIAVLAYPIAFGIAGVSSTFVPWFFGEGYEPDILLLKIASPLVVLLAIHNFLSAQYLVPSGQRARSTWGVVTGSAVNFTLNSLLIPQFQAAGALIATIISEAAICMIYFYMSKKYIPFTIFFKSSVKPFICSLIMFLLIAFVGHRGSGTVIVIIQIGIGIISYYLLTLAFHVDIVNGYTRKILAKIVRNRT